MSTYVDDNGNPIAAPSAGQYVDDNGNPVAPPSVSYNTHNNPLGWGADLAAGAAAGVANTGLGIYDLARKAVNMNTPSGQVQVLPNSDPAHKFVNERTPTTTAGKVGKYAEQAAEFMLPEAAAADALKGASTLGRIGAQAGIGGGMSAIQSGGDPTSTALGTGLGAAGSALGEALPKTFTRNVANVNNPVTEEALSSVAPNVRMTPGQRAGQAALQTNEKSLVNFPGTATEAQQFYQGVQDDLAAEGASRVGQSGTVPGVSPTNTNPYGAGQQVQQSLKDRVATLKAYADKLYNSTRQTTARNLVDVPTGETSNVPNPNAAIDPTASPVIAVPAMGKMETPVDLSSIRAQLKPVYDELTRRLAPGIREVNPAYNDLKSLMESQQQQMPAMEFDSYLGALKALARRGMSDGAGLSDPSRRIALQVINSGEQSLQNAIADAGPNVADKLTRARKAVAEYYNTSDFLNDLQSEPGALYSNLTTGGDRMVDTLKYLQQKSPAALDTVGRTFLNELATKATAEGGWGRSQGVQAAWKAMGPETKNLFFGPDLTKSLDNFYRAARVLTPPMGSPTADRLSALASYGDIGAAIGEFVLGATTGHPAVGAAGAAATLARTRAYPAILAALSFKPAGAELLRQAITLPTDSPAFARTMQALTAMGQAAATTRLGSSGKPDYTPPGSQGVLAPSAPERRAQAVLGPPAPPGIGAPQ